MAKKLTLARRRRARAVALMSIIVAVLLVGYYILFLRAAGQNVGLSTAAGTVTAPATIINDSTATGGRAVQFSGVIGGFRPPNTVKSDCSIDVSDQLNAWIAGVPNNSTASFPPGACYLAQRALDIFNKTGINFSGNGATLKRTTNNVGVRIGNDVEQINVQDSSSITISSLTIQGPKDPNKQDQTLESQHGVGLHGVSNILINNMTINNVWGDFVYMGPGVNVFLNSGVTFQNSRGFDAGRHGLGMIDGDHVTVANNVLRGVYHWIVDLEPGNNVPASNVLIDHNTTDQLVLPTSRGFVSSGGPNNGVHDVTISNNTITGYLWIYMHSTNWNTAAGRRKNFTIINNVATDPTGMGFLRTDIDNGVTIGVYGMDNVLIQNNRSQIALANGKPAYTAVGLYGSTNIRSIGNTWPGALTSIGPGTGDPGGDTACSQNDNPPPAAKIAQAGVCPTLVSLP